jgi:hypothetical protein
MSRSYDTDGIAWPSVTSILGELGKGDALTQWAANCAAEYIETKFNALIQAETVSLVDSLPEIFKAARTEFRNVGKEAMDIGSEVHHMIERHTKTRTGAEVPIFAPARPEVDNAFNAFRDWEAENISRWIAGEHTVICAEHGYAGTLDAVAEFKNGRIYVLDFKSSKGFYDEYALQIAAYRYAHDPKGEKGVNGMGILRLDKESGLPEFKNYTAEYEHKLEAFIHLCRYYYTVKDRRLKANPFTLKSKKSGVVKL